MCDALPEADDRPLVIGVGNSWRRDDGAGPAVARAVGGPWTADPAQLLDLWAGARRAIVVDAAASGAPVGTIHRFDATAAPLPADSTRASTHAFGVADAVELARVLDRLPEELLVFAVEGEDFSIGAELTAGVARAVAALAAELSARTAPPE
jgi:hydrogenase maturation protease